MKTAISLAFATLLTASTVARADVVINDSGVTQTLDCGKDPEIQVNGASANLTLTGACTKVQLNGSMSTLTIESAVKIQVNGANNTVTVDATDRIAVTGMSNTVTYKGPITAKKTKVSKTGTGNSIKRVK